jgi:hypothetical protein
MSFKRLACGLLLVTVGIPGTVVRAAGDETNANIPTTTTGIRASIERAAASAAMQPAAPLLATAIVESSASASASIPLALPRRSRVSRGVGTGMMIMSVVGTAAGIAGTYYMVKTLKDQTKTTPGS